MGESALRTAVTRYLKTQPNAMMIKVHGGPFTERGTPDYIGTVQGVPLAIELKTDDNDPSPVQLAQIERWRQAGGMACVCRSLDHVRLAVEAARERSRK